MRVVKLLVGVVGGLMVASIGSAASAGAIIGHTESLTHHAVIIFLAIWVGVGIVSFFAAHPRGAWRLVLTLAGGALLLMPLAWHGFTLSEAQIDPQSLFVQSGARIGQFAIAVCVPLGVMCFLIAYLIAPKR